MRYPERMNLVRFTAVFLLAALLAFLPARGNEISDEEREAAYDEIAWLEEVAEMPQTLALQLATLDYESALANYDMVTRGPSPEDLEVAWANVESAKAQLDTMRAGATPEQLAAESGAGDLESRLGLSHGRLSSGQLRLGQGDLRSGSIQSRLSRLHLRLGQGDLRFGPSKPGLSRLHLRFRSSQCSAGGIHLNLRASDFLRARPRLYLFVG